MKKFLTVVGFFLTVSVFAQSANDVANSLSTGDVTKFTGYLNNSVSVTLPQKAEVKGLSKSDASALIQDFFSKNNITGFERFSDSRELNGMTYIAGKLKGSKEYNITVVLKSSGANMAVITVRIF